jgi:hypothetical protein
MIAPCRNPTARSIIMTYEKFSADNAALLLIDH